MSASALGQTVGLVVVVVAVTSEPTPREGMVGVRRQSKGIGPDKRGPKASVGLVKRDSYHGRGHKEREREK